MRYLAVDLGAKRTGIAVGDDQVRIAVPAGLVEAPFENEKSEPLIRALAAAVEEHLGAGSADAGELVVGLPLNMDGSEGPAAQRVRRFAEALHQRTGRRVHLHDERLTTAVADWAMAQSGLTHKQKKARRDAIAAAAMLQAFIDALPRASPTAAP